MKFFKINKKGQVSLDQAPALIITLVVIGIIIGVGAFIMEEVKETQEALDAKTENLTSTATNSTQKTLEGIDTFAGFQTVIAIVLVAAFILGLVALIAFGRA